MGHSLATREEEENPKLNQVSRGNNVTNREEEEIDQGYKAPVNTKEENNHNENKAKYQAGEAAKPKSFQVRDQVHGQVDQLYQVRYLAGADAGPRYIAATLLRRAR